MAGLFGFFVRSRRSREWIEARFDRMSRAMVRRPHHRTHRAIFEHAAIGNSGPGLLAGCLQSYSHGSGSTMVAEGEVYRAGAWTSASGRYADAWPIVHERWCRSGADALAAVDGLYTLVRYDEAVEGPSLTILSDRYGSRRLFVHDDGDAFVFAADFAAVLGWVGASATVDRRFVEETVCLGAPLRGATWVNEITLFDPASEQRVTTDGSTKRRYWQWSDLPGPGTIRPRDPVAETYERWREVIDLRLQGEALGQQLSGGLDSRLILAEVTRRRRDWPTLTYGEKGADEVRFAARSARVAGSGWTLLDLPGPDWLDRRIAMTLENGGFVDLINAHFAGRLDELSAHFTMDLSGFVGDVTLGDTYWGLDQQGVMNKLPYWHSPVSLRPDVALERIGDALGGQGTWGFMMDVKLRRSINWLPHVRVNDVESRKPFVDYAFLEYCLGLPLELRQASRTHEQILQRYFPALARVPLARSGVRPAASRQAYLAMAAVRRGYRLLRTAGLPLRPWVRGAFDLQTWLAPPEIEARFRGALLDSNARVLDYFDRGAIETTLRQTFGVPQVSFEIAFHLLRVEMVLKALPEWQRAR